MARKKTIVIVSLVLVAVLGIWFVGRPAYQRHKERKCLQQAKQFFAKGDFRNASISARQTLQANAKNVDACRIMAELAEMTRSPHAIDWRRRIVELQPTIENRLTFAATALRAQGPPFPVAAQALEDLKAAAGNRASYQVLSGELALKLKRPRDAEAHFAEAARIEPTNELHQLNVAVLRLHSTNTALATQAWNNLQKLCGSTNIGAVALRWMVAEYLAKNDLASAERYSAQLLKDRYATLDDNLQHLSILQEAKRPDFASFFVSVQKNASTNAVAIYTVSAWMISHGMVDDALSWMGRFPPKVRAEQPVPLAYVDGYIAKKDWAKLEAYLQNQKWGDLEFLRLAFFSRAASQLDQEKVAETRWRMAVMQGQERLGALASLLALATSWKAESAREELLWQIAQRFAKERWALRELDRMYTKSGNTRGLNRLYATLAGYDPTDFVVKNNFAATSLLLNVNVAKADQIAKELYAQHPEEAILVSTYAYSLHMQGRTKPGLAVLEKLKADQLENPAVALYYGVLLSADGQGKKAVKYLDIAQKGPLLPEEKTLLDTARQAL